ncbi:MAG: hypothetical protein IJN90_04920 [Bacilli bacterium]|nr:hypothetical protein [Bacilli bacterium]
MQIDTELQAPFSYSIIPIIIVLILLFSPFIWYFLKKYIKPKTNSNTFNYNFYSRKDIASIKYNYLNKLNILEQNLSNKTITSRKAYQELSSLIRDFVFELTGLEVQTCTLKEIKKLNIPVLFELIKEYYDPEFSKISKGNITSSINKTKEVIGKWN